MSDQSTPTPVIDAPKASKPSDSKPKPKREQRTSFSVTDLARARLRERGIRSDERLMSECKVVRGILRSNFDLVRKGDVAVKRAKDAPNDRKPWPSAMNKATYDVVVGGKRAKS